MFSDDPQYRYYRLTGIRTTLSMKNLNLKQIKSYLKNESSECKMDTSPALIRFFLAEVGWGESELIT